MANRTNPLKGKELLEYKKLVATVLLEQSVPYREIHSKTGLAITTIGKLNAEKSDTSTTLLDAIRAQEIHELSKIGLLSRGIITRKLLKALEDDDSASMAAIIDAMKASFTQRRLLEGAPTAITQVDVANDKIDMIRKELAKLRGPEVEEVLMVQDSDGVYTSSDT